MTMIKARISDHEDMAGISSVTVFGKTLTRDYSEIEVSDDVQAKLTGNPTIDVMVRKSTTAAPAPAPAPDAPKPAPAPAPAPQG